jgi:hypothetical protein
VLNTSLGTAKNPSLAMSTTNHAASIIWEDTRDGTQQIYFRGD